MAVKSRSLFGVAVAVMVIRESVSVAVVVSRQTGRYFGAHDGGRRGVVCVFRRLTSLRLTSLSLIPRGEQERGEEQGISLGSAKGLKSGREGVRSSGRRWAKLR